MLPLVVLQHPCEILGEAQSAVWRQKPSLLLHYPEKDSRKKCSGGGGTLEIILWLFSATPLNLQLQEHPTVFKSHGLYLLQRKRRNKADEPNAMWLNEWQGLKQKLDECIPIFWFSGCSSKPKDWASLFSLYSLVLVKQISLCCYLEKLKPPSFSTEPQLRFVSYLPQTVTQKSTARTIRYKRDYNKQSDKEEGGLAGFISKTCTC